MENNRETKKKRKYSYKKIAISVLLLIVVLFAVLKLGGLLISAMFGHHIDADAKIIETDATSDYDYCRYGDGFLHVNSQSVKFYDEEGEYKSDALFGGYNPYVETNGDYAVLCDINSSKLSLMHKTKLVKELGVKEPVVFAKVNKRGDVIAVTSEKGYKSSVCIYDKNGKEKYIWHSGSGYVVDCVLSDDGKKFAVVALSGENGKLNSVVTWFETNKEQPCGQVIIPECFAYQLVYQGETVIVISNNGLHKVDFSEVISSIDFEGRILLGFDTDSHGNIVTSQKITNSKSVIVKYNSKLKEKFSKELDFEANYISCADKKTAISGQDNMVILNSNGKAFAKGNIVGNVKDILFSADEKKIYSFSEDKIKIYSVKLGR